MNERISALLDRYADGMLSEADARMLLGLLAKPHVAKEVTEDLALIGMLNSLVARADTAEFGRSLIERLRAGHDAYRFVYELNEDLVELAGATPSRRYRRRRPSSRSGWLIPVGFAAALALMAGVLVVAIAGNAGPGNQPVVVDPPVQHLNSRTPGAITNPVSLRDRVASLIQVDGDVSLGESPATIGQPVRMGDRIEVGVNSAAPLRYDDGSWVLLGDSTELRIPEKGEGKLLHLVQGMLEADVVSQPEGAPMVLSTHNARSTVVGTRFRLLADSRSTRLEVTEGVVRLTHLQLDKSIDIAAGYYGVVADGVEFVARLLNEVMETDARNRVAFWLLDAAADRVIRELKDGDVVNLSHDGRQLNISVEFPDSVDVNSVRFFLNGTPKQLERVFPFCMEGDRERDYDVWQPQPGRYRLRAVPYASFQGLGEAGTVATLRFTVIDR